jgi:SAM-dependent methyltransferase
VPAFPLAAPNTRRPARIPVATAPGRVDNAAMFSQSAAWYDHFYGAKDYAGEARQVTAVIRRHRPDARTLLDVACGTGRHLEHLRERFACEGLDLDEGLLAAAARRLPGVPLTRADMAEFRLGRRFDAVVCLFSSIGYLATVERLRSAVAAMAAHLEPGGVLVVEPWILPEAWIEGGVTTVEVVEHGDGKLVRVIASSRQGATSVLRIHYAAAAAGAIETADERHELRLFSHDEYAAAFFAAGLDTTWDPEGLTGRGLLVGVAPA